MTRMQLIHHPATPMHRVTSLCVALSRTGEGGLVAAFDCRCAPGALRLPDARPAEAADGLWHHTCCELFIGVAGDAAYREFNWSPSRQWAMYGFSANRARDSSMQDRTLPAPGVIFVTDAGGWTLEARLGAAVLPEATPAHIELGVAAVLEAADGGLSYWALRHPAAQPDFHRRESFVLRLGDVAQRMEGKA